MSTQETTYYNKPPVTVTNSKVTIGTSVYSLADISNPAAGGGGADFYVQVWYGGGEQAAYRSTDEDEIQGIVDALIAAKAAPPVAISGTKRCPYCAEEVLAAAVVCKHCHRNIAPAAMQAQKQVASANVLSSLSSVIGGISCLAMLAGVVIITLPWTWPLIAGLFSSR